jgi:hypothetical protein
MAAEADGLQMRPLDGNHKTGLTPIGLLMEGRGGEVPTYIVALPHMPPIMSTRPKHKRSRRR